MSRQVKTTVKTGLSLAELRQLIDFAIELYDDGHRPHIYIAEYLKGTIDHAREIRAEESARER